MSICFPFAFLLEPFHKMIEGQGWSHRQTWYVTYRGLLLSEDIRNLILPIFDHLEARWINFLISSDSWRVSGPVGFAKLGVVLIILCKESVSISDLVNKLTGTLSPHFTSAFCWTSPSPLRFKVAFGMPTFFLVWFLSFTCTRSYHAKFSEIRFIR